MNLRCLLICCLMPLLVWANPGDEAANRGIQASQMGNYEMAVKELNRSLDSGVSKYEVAQLWTLLGNSYDRLGRYGEAVEAHRRALKLAPDSHQAWTNLGVVYRHQQDYEKAEQCYRRSLELEPNHAETHSSLGILYLFRKLPKKAEASLRKAIELSPDLAPAHANLALALAMQGRHDEAEESRQKAVALGYPYGEQVRKKLEELKSPR